LLSSCFNNFLVCSFSLLIKQIKDRRQLIRESAESDPEIGVVAEQALQQQINVAILNNSKVSRTRQKIVESKAIDSITDHQEASDISSKHGTKEVKHNGNSSYPLPPVNNKHSPSSLQKPRLFSAGPSVPSTVKQESQPSDNHYHYHHNDNQEKRKSSLLPDSIEFHSDFLGSNININISSSKDQADDAEFPPIVKKEKKASPTKHLDYFLDDHMKSSLSSLKHLSPEKKESNIIFSETEKITVRDNTIDKGNDPSSSSSMEATRMNLIKLNNFRDKDANSSSNTIIVSGENEDDEIEEIYREKSNSSTSSAIAKKRFFSENNNNDNISLPPHLSLSPLSINREEGISHRPPQHPPTSDLRDEGYHHRQQPQPPILNQFMFSSHSDDEYMNTLTSIADSSGGNNGITLANLHEYNELQQIKFLKKFAKMLEKRDDYQAAELLYERALEIDPTNISILHTFAIFLHQKKGELGRAEAFFNRALKICLQSLQLQVSTPQRRKSLMKQQFSTFWNQSVPGSSVSAVPGHSSAFNSPSSVSSSMNLLQDSSKLSGLSSSSSSAGFPSSSSTNISVENGVKINDVIQLLLSFANFMIKSKGDIESSFILLEKAVQLAPTQAVPLAHYGHFLSEHCNDDEFLLMNEPANQTPSSTSAPSDGHPHPPSQPLPPSVAKDSQFQKIDNLFRSAMKYQPGNITHMMWYGKFLKKYNKLGPAELMYRSAMECAKTSFNRNKVEPTAICNYATFLLKKRKNYEKAEEMFVEGLAR
jgi:tetratricopeptide (TPR) repeat protein